MSARPITTVALIQIFLVVAGYLSLVGVLKILGYPNRSLGDWKPFTIFLREYGWSAFLLPAAFVALGLYSEFRKPSEHSDRRTVVLGILLCLVIFFGFLAATVDNRFPTPIIKKQSPSAPAIPKRLQVPDR